MMRVAFCLPDLESYRDRLHMVCALSACVDELYLLTNTIDDESETFIRSYPNLVGVPLGRKKFKENAFDWLYTKTRLDALDIIHDTFGHLSAFFQASASIQDRPFRLLSTLYTNNWGWFQRVRKPHMDFGWSYVAQRIVTLWRDRRVCTSADRVLVLGPGLEEELVRGHGIDPERVQWLPSEIDTELFCPIDAKPQSERLLFTGAICRNKGVDLLIDALGHMKKSRPSLRLVGRVLPWEKKWFEDALRSSGLGDRIECPGPIHRLELVHEYRQAHLYVFPSRFEGSPRSVREALASGLPCVLSDLPGHRAVDPESAFTYRVSQFDAEAWAHAIQIALSETHDAWSERRRLGVEQMRTAHRPEAVAHQLLNVYKRTVELPPIQP